MIYFGNEQKKAFSQYLVLQYQKMKKFRPLLTESELKELKRLSSLDFSSYTESDVREEFLVELLKLLGYRKDLDYSVSREESFNLNPLFLSVGSKRIKLDYLCSLRKQYFWIIDAKDGKCRNSQDPPKIEIADIGQTHFYSLHPEINCRYFIVSNGWYVNLYDRDNLDNELTPLVSIRSSELTERFLELDSYVGATQILPTLKDEILDQIEKIFSAEIRVERLDEFIDAVSERAARLRSKVEEAARDNYQKNNSKNEILKQLETEDISTTVYSVFQHLRTRSDIRVAAQKLIVRIKENHVKFTFKEYFFFSRLMLEKPYPVNFWYYSNVLHFLFQANKSGLTAVYFGQKNIEILLFEWIDLCLFHLSSKRAMRYMWACERLYAKIIKQSIIMMPSFREKIRQILAKELFYLPEEELAPLGPDHAGIMIKTIEMSLAHFRATFVSRYFDKNRYSFREALAHQHYLSLKEISRNLDVLFGDRYQKVKDELGVEWRDLQFYEHLSFDRMGSAICDVLCWNDDQLHLLNDKHRQRIKMLAELGCTNFAEELCDKLALDYNKSFPEAERLKAVERFFDPSEDQFLLAF